MALAALELADAILEMGKSATVSGTAMSSGVKRASPVSASSDNLSALTPTLTLTPHDLIKLKSSVQTLQQVLLSNFLPLLVLIVVGRGASLAAWVCRLGWTCCGACKNGPRLCDGCWGVGVWLRRLLCAASAAGSGSQG